MYAVIETGGKQYKVSPGEILDVELLENKTSITFSDVLMIADGDKVEIGTPYIKGAKVSAKVLGETKGKKVTTFKYKNKTNYHRTIGHRQLYSRVQIEDFVLLRTEVHQHEVKDIPRTESPRDEVSPKEVKHGA